MWLPGVPGLPICGIAATLPQRPCASLPIRVASLTLNLMVQFSPLDRTLAAMADPPRRAALGRLGHGTATITEPAEPYGTSLPGIRDHVRMLEEAGLVA